MTGSHAPCTCWFKKKSHHEFFDNVVPFTIGRGWIVDVPIYINDMTGLTVNLPGGTQSADRLKAAIPLTIKVAA
jgi:hypothetical protein